MKELLKNLGFIFIIIGVSMLVIAFLTDHINNAVLGFVAALILIGLVSYIFINKRMR